MIMAEVFINIFLHFFPVVLFHMPMQKRLGEAFFIFQTYNCQSFSAPNFQDYSQSYYVMSVVQRIGSRILFFLPVTLNFHLQDNLY